MLTRVVQHLSRLQHKVIIVAELILTKIKTVFVLWTCFSPSGCKPVSITFVLWAFSLPALNISWRDLSLGRFFHTFPCAFRTESAAAAHVDSTCSVCLCGAFFLWVCFLLIVSQARDCWPANSNSKCSFWTLLQIYAIVFFFYLAGFNLKWPNWDAFFSV